MIIKKYKFLNLDSTNTMSGTVYPSAEVQKVIDTLGNTTCFGELQQAIEPNDRLSVATSVCIKPENVAFTVFNLHIEDHGLYGDIKLLDTIDGNILKSIKLDELLFTFVFKVRRQEDPNTKAGSNHDLDFIKVLAHIRKFDYYTTFKRFPTDKELKELYSVRD